MADERRHNRRLPFATSCRLTLGQQALPAQLIDISMNGALVQVDAAVANPEGPATLHLQLDEAGAVTIDIQTEIAFARDGKLGLRRKSIDLESMTHLRRMLELNLGSAELMERELSEMVEHA